MNRVGFLFVTCLSILLSSCFKKDDIITLPPQSGAQVNEVAGLGKNGDTTIYYSLKDNKIVKKSMTYCWDICFESNTTSNAVFINGGKNIRAYNTQESSFGNVTLINALVVNDNQWLCDKPALLDTDAYIKWQTQAGQANAQIYIIKLDNSNNNFIKFRVLAADDNKFVIEYADINELATTQTIEIIKNKSANYTYFSFANGGAIVNDVEPAINSWDIMLTQYGFIYEDLNNFTYNVKGVLLNPNNTLGYGDTVNAHDFAKVSADDVAALPLSKNRDVIGYLWKKLPDISGNYVVYPEFLYLVQTQHNELYKLHFLSYYSNTGEGHCPKFEFQRLK